MIIIYLAPWGTAGINILQKDEEGEQVGENKKKSRKGLSLYLLPYRQIFPAYHPE
jgi:hypothetical protein